MLKQNFEKKTHNSLGIFEYVLLQIVVERRYNESRSTIVRLDERYNVIGTAIPLTLWFTAHDKRTSGYCGTSTSLT